MAQESPSRKEFIARTVIVTAVIAATIVLLFVLRHIAQMLLVLFAGVLLAVLLDNLANRLTRLSHAPRPITLIVVIVILLLVGTLFGWFIGPRIADQMSGLVERIPEALTNVQDELRATALGRQVLRMLTDPREILKPGSELFGQVTGIFSSALGALTSVVITFFIGIYLAANPRSYMTNATMIVPPAKRERAMQVLVAVGRALRWWLAGRLASMAIVGVLTAIGFWIAGIPLALTLGLIAAVLSFVPLIGPTLAAIPMILVALAEDPTLVIWALLVYGIVQLLETYVITPGIQKEAVFIPPALLLSVEILLGVLFGIPGILLATPIAVIGIVLVQMLYIEDVLGDSVRVMGDHGPQE
ncbi:MAG: AI-2E family transporter [candidate division Zixibacteria bacterium]|nr:AI-2E family transporter [candidate division Zixibacteria bacterium]